jgi:hypothetical protein
MTTQTKKVERHPNGTPFTIHHYDEKGEPVYHHEVVAMDPEELKALGHSHEAAHTISAAAKQSAGSAAAEASLGPVDPKPGLVKALMESGYTEAEAKTMAAAAIKERKGK